jgi:D-alanyl-D-alanine endopeptidase (penicillin-binding protein 7)
MFQAIAQVILASIFLSSSASTYLDFLPANTLPLAGERAEAVMPEKNQDSKSIGVNVTAKSFIVVEPETGAVIYEKNSSNPRSIASITKLMTALVFLENNPGWDKEIVMEKNDYRPGAKPLLLLGDKVTVRDLFYSMLVASSNEGAVALARSTGLAEKDFVDQMNFMSRFLEMKNSKFVEPTGLSDDNRASAEDLIKLIKVTFSHSEIRKAGATKTYTVKVKNQNAVRNLESTDKILTENFGLLDKTYKIEAGKTGFTNSAGYCFTSQVKDGEDRKLLIAVLGSSSTYDRFIDTKSLAYWVFSNYKW